jgi:hypothetical protein
MAPPLGILAALLVSPGPSVHQPSYLKAKLLFGMFPLWAAIAVVAVGSYVSGSTDYWSAAPWLIIASIPACALPLGLIEFLARRRHRAERPSSSK